MKPPLSVLILGTLTVAAMLAMLVYFDVHKPVLQLLRWFEELGYWAALLFILVMALVVVLLLPGALLTTGAGFVFGILQGSIIVVLGTTLGSAIAFLAARYLFRRRAELFFQKHARVRLLSEQLSLSGWKVVLLTRLIPFFPSKVANYFFGLTNLAFRDYFLGSLLGFVPFSVHNVYLGSIAADIVMLEERDPGRTPLEWAIYGLGFVATLVAVIYINRLASRALPRYRREDSEEVEP